MTSFRPIEKYFKANLLTPFGIHVDALMVVDGKGNVCLLNEYLGYTTVLVSYYYFLFKNIIILSIFSAIFKISQSDLAEQSVIKRIDLIKKKLVKASQKTDEIFIE